MRKNILVIPVAMLLILATACRPKATLPPPPPTPTALPPTPTLAPAVVATRVAEVAPVQVIPVDMEAPAEPEAQPVAPISFTGMFEGVLMGDNDSTAPARLELVQDGAIVNGTLSLGSGLLVEGGNCGSTAVPGGSVAASGQIDPQNPTHMDAASMFYVQGIGITVSLAGDLSADGQSINADATIDLPLLCGRDPALTGTFTRLP